MQLIGLFLKLADLFSLAIDDDISLYHLMIVMD